MDQRHLKELKSNLERNILRDNPVVKIKMKSGFYRPLNKEHKRVFGIGATKFMDIPIEIDDRISGAYSLVYRGGI